MLRKLILLAATAALFATAPALAQRGGGDHHENRGGNDHRGGGDPRGGGGNWAGGDHRGNDRDHRGNDWGDGRNNDWNRDWDRHRNDRDHWDLSFSFGLPSYSYFDSYRYSPGYAYPPTHSWNAWGLAPYECRWDREFGYWYNRPANIEVRRCADQWGNVYIVDGSQRLWGYR